MSSPETPIVLRDHERVLFVPGNPALIHTREGSFFVLYPNTSGGAGSVIRRNGYVKTDLSLGESTKTPDNGRVTHAIEALSYTTSEPTMWEKIDFANPSDAQDPQNPMPLTKPIAINLETLNPSSPLYLKLGKRRNGKDSVVRIQLETESYRNDSGKPGIKRTPIITHIGNDNTHPMPFSRKNPIFLLPFIKDRKKEEAAFILHGNILLIDYPNSPTTPELTAKTTVKRRGMIIPDKREHGKKIDYINQENDRITNQLIDRINQHKSSSHSKEATIAYPQNETVQIGKRHILLSSPDLFWGLHFALVRAKKLTDSKIISLEFIEPQSGNIHILSMTTATQLYKKVKQAYTNYLAQELTTSIEKVESDIISPMTSNIRKRLPTRLFAFHPEE